MPCASEHMEVSGHELESKRVCKLLIYLNGVLGNETEAWVRRAAKDYYGNVARLNEATKDLCELCRGLTKKEADKYIWNGRDKKARKLADWFERHKEWDERRVKEENKARKKVHAKERALKKLTPDEIKALGLI